MATEILRTPGHLRRDDAWVALTGYYCCAIVMGYMRAIDWRDLSAALADVPRRFASLTASSTVLTITRKFNWVNGWGYSDFAVIDVLPARETSLIEDFRVNAAGNLAAMLPKMLCEWGLASNLTP